MFKLFRKWWNYLTAKLSGSFEAHADPKVQLEQAITEAKTQHVRLKEQAANVIANQKQGELRLNAKLGELEKLNANARQALRMADDAQQVGRRPEGGAVQLGGRDHHHPADPGGKGHREPEDTRARGGAGVRSGQGGRRAERPSAAAEDQRTVEAAVAARPGEDAGGDELGDGVAERDDRRRRADVQRGRAEDPGSLHTGQGDVGAERRLGRVAGARSRAGHRQRRGPGPPEPAARRARPRPRPCRRTRAGNLTVPASAEPASAEPAASAPASEPEPEPAAGSESSPSPSSN